MNSVTAATGHFATTLPLEMKLGQLFVVHLPSEGRLQDVLDDFDKHHFGGIFLKAENFRSIDQMRRLTDRFRRGPGELPPPVVAVDEEGGLVSTLGHLTSTAPSAAALGVLDDPDVTEDCYFGMAEKVRALGFNTLFAPVCDVNAEVANPVIGTRSFGNDPQRVIRHALRAMEGIRASGLACAVKHFPGHGSTRLDSHRTLPTVRADRKTMDARDLPPFTELLDREEPPELVMTAHVAYPALDKSGLPATLSPPILRDLLRRELGYQGVIITDSMDMHAVAEGRTPGQAAIEAINAGADLLLYGDDTELASRAYREMLEGLEKSRLTEERLNVSLERVFTMRRRFQGLQWVEEEDVHRALEVDHEAAFYGAALEGLEIEGNAGALAELAAIDRGKVIVLPKELGPRPLPLGIVHEQLEPAGFTVILTESTPTREDIDRARRAAAEAKGVVVGTVSRGPMAEPALRLVAEVTAPDIPSVGVALLDPADADRMMTANCRIKTFGYSAPQLWALCQKLLG